MPLSALATRLDAHLAREGSTRAISLVRIGFACAVIAEWSERMSLFSAPPSLARTAVAFVFFASAWMLLLGAWSRIAALLSGFTMFFLYSFGESVGVPNPVHHHTWILAACVSLLALTPCGGSFSLDRLRALDAAQRAGRAAPPERGPLWAVPLLSMQATAAYFWSAFDKTSVGFLSGDRLEAIYARFYTGLDLPGGTLFALAFMAASIAAVLLEYSLAIGLWFPRWHRVLMPAGALFHLVIYCTLPVETFTTTMLVLYVTFVRPEKVDALLARLFGAGMPEPSR